MTARRLAILILVLFLIIPLVLYWFFYRQNVTSLVFLNEYKYPYTIRLEGSLSFSFFPLLDRLFLYESTCIGSCIFSPIPPLRYTLSLTATGRESISTSLTPLRGEMLKFQVSLPPSLEFESIGSIPTVESTNINAIGTTIYGDILTFGQSDANGTPIYSSRRSEPLLIFPFSFSQVILDRTRQFLIFEGDFPGRSIVSITGRESIQFPFDENIISVDERAGIWKVRTEASLYEYRDRWIKNPRFTDYIDLSNRYRLGYIDASDSQKKELQNIESGGSIFLLIDRMSTDAVIVRSGLDIEAFLTYDSFPSVLLDDGSIERIIVTLDQ